MTGTTSPDEEERLLVDAFVVRPKKARWIAKLAAGGRRREELLETLAHTSDLDARWMRRVAGGQQRPKAIAEALTSLGAPDECHVLSEDAKLDGRRVPLLEALDAVVGHGLGTLISCVPGRLAYYEGESPGERFILSRPR